MPESNKIDCLFYSAVNVLRARTRKRARARARFFMCIALRPSQKALNYGPSLFLDAGVRRNDETRPNDRARARARVRSRVRVGDTAKSGQPIADT